MSETNLVETPESTTTKPVLIVKLITGESFSFQSIVGDDSHIYRAMQTIGKQENRWILENGDAIGGDDLKIKPGIRSTLFKDRTCLIVYMNEVRSIQYENLTVYQNHPGINIGGVTLRL